MPDERWTLATSDVPSCAIHPRNERRDVFVAADKRSRVRTQGNGEMFFFFSNRLGCLGSLLLSAAVTVVLLLIFGVARF